MVRSVWREEPGGLQSDKESDRTEWPTLTRSILGSTH